MRGNRSSRQFPTWRSSAEGRRYLGAYNGAPNGGTNYAIGLMESWDNVHWTKLTPSSPALEAGASGTWEAGGVKDPWLLKINSTYHMWYMGFNSTVSQFEIGHATSSNGVVWTKDSANPVLTVGVSGAWDDTYIESPCVIYESGVFKMWYAGAGTATGDGREIGYATSSDGSTWTKYVSNPVLTLGATYDSAGLWPRAVVNNAGAYNLFYAGRPHSGSVSNDAVCLATFTSPTGAYTKSGSNPILSASTAEQALTSNLAAGSVTVNVASTSAFHAGEPCLMFDSTDTQADCVVETINSGTQMTLAAAASGTYSWTTADSASIRSAYYSSLDPSAVVATPTGWVMYCTAFQQFGSAILSERSVAATSSSLGSGWAFDYTRGLVLPLGTQWDTYSAENPCVISE